MLDSSNSSLYDATKEWKEKADDALQASLARFYSSIDAKQRRTTNTTSISRLLAQTKRGPSQKEIDKENEMKEKQDKQWTRTQIEEINIQAEKEMESLNRLKAQQQQQFQAQLNEKNDVWDKVLIERRAEAAKLRFMISKLSNEISHARNEAKSAIDAAKKEENENLRAIRLSREKLIRQISALTSDIQKEKIMFESENRLSKSTSDSNLNQKQDTLARLQSRLAALEVLHTNNESNQQLSFKAEMKKIKELRELLELKNQEIVQKQSDIMAMKKQCASMARLICARKDEASSYDRQITAIKKDNERIEDEIAKMDRNSLPLRRLSAAFV